MNESLTPETDRNLTPTGHIYVSSSSPHVSADFARKLERQRDDAREKLQLAELRVTRAKRMTAEMMGWLEKARKEAEEFRDNLPGGYHRFSWEEEPDASPKFHSPACQLSDKCQCDEPEVELSREDIEAERGDRAYQQMKDDEE